MFEPDRFRQNNESPPVTPALEVEDLSISYGGVLGLAGANLMVPANGAVSLLGPNGAGKSTLLRAASGLLSLHGGRVVGGRVRYFGDDITRTDAARLVRSGLVQVLEGRHVFTEMTVSENLSCGAFTRRSGVAEAKEHMLEVFPRLRRHRGTRAGLLSGGEQQMLAIARAMMARPRLLLLDEPSLGLAPVMTAAIGQALCRINESGTSILLVDQSTALARAVTTWSYLLDTGSVRADGATEALLADDDVKSVYLGVRS